MLLETIRRFKAHFAVLPEAAGRYEVLSEAAVRSEASVAVLLEAAGGFETLPEATTRSEASVAVLPEGAGRFENCGKPPRGLSHQSQCSRKEPEDLRTLAEATTDEAELVSTGVISDLDADVDNDLDIDVETDNKLHESDVLQQSNSWTVH